MVTHFEPKSETHYITAITCQKEFEHVSFEEIHYQKYLFDVQGNSGFQSKRLGYSSENKSLIQLALQTLKMHMEISGSLVLRRMVLEYSFDIS